MAEKNFAISVIIPMFNAENFVGECLTSLANQTFQNFEIVIVDDCSTDNSMGVAQSFSNFFGGRLKLGKLSANSGHPGIPRNFALEAASGEYVYFLDSDDFLTTAALEELYTVAKKFDADVVHAEKCFTFRGEDDIRIESLQTGEFVTEPTLETFDIGERVTGFTQKKFLWWACNKLFRRKFLRENKITFPAIKSFEDFVFAFECLVAAKNYVRVPSVSYFYRIRKNSLSHEGRDAVGSAIMVIKVVKALDDFMSGKKFFVDNPQCKYDVLDFFIRKQLEDAANFLFVLNNTPLGEAFNFFRDKVFSANPQESISLTSYLFIETTILKLHLNQQATEIDELKRQLAALKK